MKRIEAIEVVAGMGDVVISNIGFPSRELYALGDRAGHFYMLGSMGMAGSIGLGVALAKPDRRIYVIEGDGSVLMNLGSLATVANCAPENYCLVIMDNGVYASTGNQPSHTGGKTDLLVMARGAGIKNAEEVDNTADLRKVLERYRAEMLVIVAKVEAFNAEVPVIPLSAKYIKERFMKNLGLPCRHERFFNRTLCEKRKGG